MAKPYAEDLRERVVAALEGVLSRRQRFPFLIWGSGDEFPCRRNLHMLGSGSRHLLLLLVLALMTTGAPSLALGRHHRHHGNQPSARMDEERSQERGKPTVFTASINGMIRACAEQAAALRKLPPETIVQAVQLNDDQRAALEEVRASAGSAAERLDANCPKDIPAELGVKLDTLDHVVILLADALSGLRPAVLNFHALLNDDQKGRLIAMRASANPASHSSRNDPASGSGADADAKSICTQWVAILRAWPVMQIDAGMQLSDAQRAAFHELSAAIYRSAGHSVEACPADNPVTALGRLDAKQNELQAMRQDIEAIRPSTATFEDALNDVQKKRLAEAMGSETQWSGGMTRDQAREFVSQSPVNRGNHHGGFKIGSRGQRFAPVRWSWFGFAYTPHWRRY
jgi:hypothetical protein